MPKLMTKEDVKIIQFYQMPKIFFGTSRYAPMRNEAKLAYMLLQDLLPLSVENNWINEKGEVFVKLSRAKLMSLLNIKGTQKIAQIMKELVDYRLIIYKQVGLSKCNEIYLYLPFEDNPVDKKQAPKPQDTQRYEIESSTQPKITPTEGPKSNANSHEIQTHIKNNSIKTNSIKTNITQSLFTEDGGMDLEILYERFSKQLHIDYLSQRYNPNIVEEVIHNICHMYLSKTIRIEGQEIPNGIIRSTIARLKMYHVEHVIDQFLKSSAQYPIHHAKRYLQSLIYNSVFEANITIRGQIKRDLGY